MELLDEKEIFKEVLPSSNVAKLLNLWEMDLFLDNGAKMLPPKPSLSMVKT